MKTIFGFTLYFSVYSFHAEMIVSFSEDVMKSGCALQYTMWSGVKLPASGLNASSPAAKPITSLLQTKCTVDGSPLSALRTGAADTAASVSNGTSEKSGRRIMSGVELIHHALNYSVELRDRVRGKEYPVVREEEYLGARVRTASCTRRAFRGRATRACEPGLVDGTQIASGKSSATNASPP